MKMAFYRLQIVLFILMIGFTVILSENRTPQVNSGLSRTSSNNANYVDGLNCENASLDDDGFDLDFWGFIDDDDRDDFEQGGENIGVEKNKEDFRGFINDDDDDDPDNDWEQEGENIGVEKNKEQFWDCINSNDRDDDFEQEGENIRVGDSKRDFWGFIIDDDDDGRDNDGRDNDGREQGVNTRVEMGIENNNSYQNGSSKKENIRTEKSIEKLKSYEDANSRKVKSHISSAATTHRPHTEREIALNLIRETSRNLRSVINGKAAGHVPPDIYGETLEQEISGWKLLYRPFDTDQPEHPYSIPSDSELILSFELSRNHFPEEISGRQKLYGGAQYHRTLRSFYHRIRTVQIPFSTSEEISLLMGGTSRGAMHSGGDILRSVAILASRRMETLADLLLNELAERMLYVLERMWSVAEYATLVRPERNVDLTFVSTCMRPSGTSPQHQEKNQKTKNMSVKDYDVVEEGLKEFMTRSFEKFMQSKVACAHEMAKDDIFAMIKYINWDAVHSQRQVNNIDRGGSQAHFSTTGPKTREDMRAEDSAEEFGDYSSDDLAEEDGDIGNRNTAFRTNGGYASINEDEGLLATVVQAVRSFTASDTSSMTRINFAINALVQQVTESWRHDISHTIMTKFNSFCLLPFHEEFEAFLRSEIERNFLGRDVP